MAVHVESKGRVTIPKRVRDLPRMEPGSAVEFHNAADGRVTLRKQGRAAQVLDRFAALRGHATAHMKTDEIRALTRCTVRTRGHPPLAA
jgi:antitoxin PrlF